MLKSLVYVLLLVAVDAKKEHSLSKRVLPTSQNCDPRNQACRKGDWTPKHVADCRYTGFLFSTCNARNGATFHWTVDVAVGDKCVPKSGLQFQCGAPGTDTRCVCSDTNPFTFKRNSCRCQYWPAESSAQCIGYYQGGTSGVHHWACCDNCNDPSNTCDAVMWQGGSSRSYCSNCGVNTGGGEIKYYFNCGGCSTQQRCKNDCSGPIRNLPGMCWRWLDCFKGCCIRNSGESSRQIGFCGDGTCDADESSTTCPVDCCPTVNSMCAADNLCQRECCGTPDCCRNSASNIETKHGLLIFLLSLALAITIM